MKVRFNTEPSRFAPLIQEALAKSPDSLGNGERVSIKVPIQAATKRGFEREAVVTIGPDPNAFDAEWPGEDPSRFGARLRAAATVLRDLGYKGTFRVEREGQTVTIQRVSL